MNFDEIRAVTSELIRSDRQAAAILKKIASGKATFADTMKYSLICSKVTSKQLASVIGEPDEELEELAGALLRDRYDDINTSCSAVQRALDEKNGLHLAPQKAAFPSERVAKFAHSLIDPTVSDETIKRRAKSGSANITMSFHDDFIKENADFRTKAGLECYVERQTDGKCCPWCSAVAGRYLMREQPKDLFRRHDNCECVIVYDEKVLRGAVSANGRRGKKWTDSGERAERIKFAESQKPTVLSHDEAEKLQAELLPRRLTGGENGGIINYRDSEDGLFSITEQAVKNMPSVGFLGGETALKYDAECKNLLIYAMNSGYDTGTEFSIILDENMNRIDEHNYVIGQKGSTPIDDYHKPYHALHNHGSDETLSIRDLSNFLRRENQKSITAIGNRGSRYVLSETDTIQSARYFVYVVDQSNRVFFTTSQGVGLKLKDFTDEIRKVRTSPLVNGLPETEIAEIKKALVNKTREILIGGEKYGYKYYEKRASD